MKTQKITSEQKTKCKKIDKYYYLDPEGKKRKYRLFCRHKDCTSQASYNFQNNKRPKYWLKHKKPRMVNVKKGHKLCEKCEGSYIPDKGCKNPKCKHDIKKYKDSSK